MRTDLFDFELPPERIALRPASPRDSARMLVVQGGGISRSQRCRPAAWLAPGDQLVVNDTKVIAAQLKGRRIGRETEPKIDATLIKRLDGSRWQALVKPAKKLRPGDRVRFGNEGKVCLLGHLDAEVEAKGGEGEVTLSFSFHGPALDQAIADLGRPPLPPYIAASARPTSRIAPTIRPCSRPRRARSQRPPRGCISRRRSRRRCAAAASASQRLTLHVGAGTFLPVKADDTADHKMHAEWGRITAATAERAQRGAARGRPHHRGRHHLAAAARKRRGRGRHHPAVRGRHRDLHHARLPLPRGRRA